MAVLTISTVSPALCEKPESYVACENDFAATAIQSAARVFLAKKQWEYLYVQHIANEILRLQEASRSKRNKARRRKILDQTAIVVQTMVRGHLVRKQYRESDKMLRNNEARGLSLMESVRKRMDIRQKIEALKQQLSEVREARNTHSDDDDENDDHEEISNNYTDEVSARKVEELKAIQHKLNIKAKTLEAVTRPLQEKFDSLRAENEKLLKKYGKIESKNESRKYSNETKTELLAEKHKLLQETRDELAFTEDGVSMERSKAQQRLDTLVETSSAYASLGMTERDAATFSDEVARIGKEAHRKAKLFRDSLRMTSNLTKSWSSRSLTSNTVDTTAAVATTSSTPATKPTTKPTMKKTQSASSLSDDGGHRPVKRGHGRVLRNLLRDRSASSESEQNRSLSPTLNRQDSSFSSMSSGDEQPSQQSKMLRKGQRYFIKRDKGRSLSPQRRNNESVFVKREKSRRSLLLDRGKSRTPSPQRRSESSTFVKRTRTPSPTTKLNGSSANNTPVISNKMKFKSSNSTTPKLSDKAKVGDNTITPKTTNTTSNNTPKSSTTPKMSNTHTPRTTNVTTSKPMRRTYSEANTPISEMKRGLRKVLSERSMMLSSDVPSRSRIHKLKEELRDECTKGGRKSRSKSRDRKNSTEPKKLKNKKKSINRKTKSQSPSHSTSPKGNNGRNIVGGSNKNNSRSNSRSGSNRDEEPRRSVDRQFSGSGGLLRGKRPTTHNNDNEADSLEQPRRHVSLTAPKIELRKNKRSYMRRTISLTESSKSRRKFVDECIDSGGMMPSLA